MTRPRRTLLIALLALAVAPAVAFGHAEVQQAEHPAGQRGTVTIRIPHGCGSESGAVTDTDRISTLVPSGFRAVQPRNPKGWRSTVAAAAGGFRVEWIRTARSSAVKSFPIAVRFPSRKGSYALPTVQYCGSRSVSWIEKPVGGQEPDHPVPTIIVG